MEYGSYFTTPSSTDLANPFMNFTPVSNSNGTNNSLATGNTSTNIYNQYTNPYSNLGNSVTNR